MLYRPYTLQIICTTTHYALQALHSTRHIPYTSYALHTTCAICHILYTPYTLHAVCSAHHTLYMLYTLYARHTLCTPYSVHTIFSNCRMLYTQFSLRAVRSTDHTLYIPYALHAKFSLPCTLRSFILCTGAQDLAGCIALVDQHQHLSPILMRAPESQPFGGAGRRPHTGGESTRAASKQGPAGMLKIEWLR